MKKITITLFILTIGLMGAMAQANWDWTQQTSGTTEALRDVFFINSTTGWVVGSNGVILNTVNGGETWTAQTSGTDQELSSVHFVDENTGWTTGGGLTAKPAPLLKTIDGGATWSSIDYNFQAFTIRELFFADKNTGWIIRTDSIYVSSDGGLSWTHDHFAESVEGPLDNRGIYAVSDSVAYIAGRSKRSGSSKTATAFDRRIQAIGGAPYWGIDGANQFTQTDVLKCIDFANDTVGFIGGSEGRIYRMQQTSGITNGPWDLNLDLEEDRTIWSISFGSSNVGMFNTSIDIESVSTALVYHTEDQGETWTSEPDTVSDILSSRLFTADESNAWMVASGGKIFKGTPDYSSIFEKKPSINLTVHPNPTSGVLKIQSPDRHDYLSISLIDPTGRVIFNTVMDRTEDIELEIKGEPGIYIVRAINGKGQQGVLKVVKE